MHYFAYGSNMSTARLYARVPGVQRLGTVSLRGHALRFHKVGRDGSGKCDAWYTGVLGDAIHGVLYRIDAEHRRVLDRVEGLGKGYDIRQVVLEDAQGQGYEAITYVATDIDVSLSPFDWYRQHVLVGAREAGLPQAYVQAIQAVSVTVDLDQARRERELAVHR